MTSSQIFPAVPRTQALSTKTFTPPPLDGSMLLPEMCDWHRQHSLNHPLFVYARQNGELQAITWTQVAEAIYTGTRLVRNTMGWQPGHKDTQVVGILAPSETISYYTLIMSIMRAGYTAFPISPRNSPMAVAHLINKVGVKHIFLGREQAMADLKDKAFEQLQPGQEVPSFGPIPVFEDFYRPSSDHCGGDDLIFEKKSLDDIAMYMHSSGSTNFPKPIAWTHSHVLRFAMSPYFGERDLTGVNISLHSTPMFHSMGTMQICWTFATGLVINAFEPKLPPPAPTAQNIFEGIMACHSELVICVPALVEEWAQNPQYVQGLAKTSGILFGGGPLSKAAGDLLTSQGVQLFNLYGLTEVGPVTTAVPSNMDPDWHLFSFCKALDIEMVPQGDGLYECVIRANSVCQPAVINTTRNGVDAYATSDLFTPCLDRPGLWEMYGRKDDQIMHSTGEKTNPGPLEHILDTDPHIRSSVIFGRGQFQAGVIIDPQPDAGVDVEDKAQAAAFVEKIWPTVQRMNEFAPQHSRIFKEMIILAKPSKPFQYTAKNTPRRHLIIQTYDDEIKATYAAANSSSASDIPPPSKWEGESLLSFVRAVTTKVLSREVKDTDDIFQHGGDSLQATWIRNTIINVLKNSTAVETDTIATNVVYEYPTIASLTTFLGNLVSGKQGATGIDVAARASAMRSMVEKYTVTEFPIHPRAADKAEDTSPSSGDVVLVTGTTGGLGTYLFAELISNPSVSRVYAVNRGKDSTALRERQKKALVQRGVNPQQIMDSEKLVLLVADTSAPLLGLSENEYETIRSSLTHVIHNAWPVDFNLSLTSFESSIRGLRNLVELSLSSSHPTPPTIVFASTIGMLQNHDPSPAKSIPETPIEAEVAVGNGYTEGKWVSEEILQYASSHADLNSIVVRVGQLSGGSNGSWNIAEWLPSLIQSAQAVGCLPTEDKDIDWIPVHLAAKAVVDYRRAGSPGSSSLVHLVHPQPTSWAKLASIAAQDLSVPLVSYVQWLEKLEGAATRNGDSAETSVESLKAIPALRLLDFYRVVASNLRKEGNAFGLPRLSCENAVRLSPTLSEGIPPLGEQDVKSWLNFWKEVGYVKTH
ncbi:acetyl-CoA synthetase-like protein [Agrocybe pediades]|nr:acetyl-CoA synthetase-like protein [Agrocybe pediades]